MKRIVLALTCLLATSSAAFAQVAHSTETLRGLAGVRLIVRLGRYPHRLDEAQRPEVLKMVEADTKAKLEKAGIPFSRSRFEDEIGNAGNPRLVITVTMGEGISSMPVTTEVELFQRVRLSRDSSIETDAVTWRAWGGVGGLPTQRDLRIRDEVGTEIESFIRDYFSVNPKQSAAAAKETLSSRRQSL